VPQRAQSFHDGTSGQTVIPGGPPFPPLDLIHAQICLSDPDVPYNECPNNYPNNSGNTLGYQLNPKILSLLSQGFKNARDAGLKVILRFTYNWPCSDPSVQALTDPSATCSPGPENDAPLSVILDHMRALAPVILENSDVINALQAGFIGRWGEWHNSTEGNDNKQTHNAFLDQFTELFSPTLQLEVRRPYVILDYATYRYQNRDDAHVLALGLGMHDDEFGSNVDDAGTFAPELPPDPDPTPYTTCELRHAAQLVSSAFTMTGETSAIYGFSDAIPCDDSVPKPTSYIEFSADYSLSTLQIKFAELVWQNFLNTPGLYDSVLASVGPHLSLSSASFVRSSTNTVRMTLALHNTGWASIANYRPLWASLSGPGAWGKTVQIPVNLSDVKPGQYFTADVDLPIGSATSSETYSVYVYSPDASPQLAKDPRYNLLFENDAVPDPKTGLNRIGLVTAEP
jgi:hypothetical protein